MNRVAHTENLKNSSSDNNGPGTKLANFRFRTKCHDNDEGEMPNSNAIRFLDPNIFRFLDLIFGLILLAKDFAFQRFPAESPVFEVFSDILDKIGTTHSIVCNRLIIR